MKRTKVFWVRHSARCAGVITLLLAITACAGGDGGNAAADDEAATATKAAAAPRMVIVEPENDAQIGASSVLIVLSAENIQIAAAGDTTPGTGHHHLFVNTDVTPPGMGIPAGVSGIIHLGQAQTSHELTGLAPGNYTVISVVGDLVHRRIEPQVMDTVRFRVLVPTN